MAWTSDIQRRLRAPPGYVNEQTIGKEKVQNEAQQAFRFYLKINHIHAAFISDVTRPSYTIDTKEHRLLNWNFKYPTGVKWTDVSFTVREVFSPDLSMSIGGIVMRKIESTSIDAPDKVGFTSYSDLSKEALVSTLGEVGIMMLTPDGGVYEEWMLLGAFIKDVKFSDLAYNQDDLTNVRITLSYDWARLTYNPNAPSTALGGVASTNPRPTR